MWSFSRGRLAVASLHLQGLPRPRRTSRGSSELEGASGARGPRGPERALAVLGRARSPDAQAESGLRAPPAWPPASGCFSPHGRALEAEEPPQTGRHRVPVPDGLRKRRRETSCRRSLCTSGKDSARRQTFLWTGVREVQTRARTGVGSDCPPCLGSAPSWEARGFPERAARSRGHVGPGRAPGAQGSVGRLQYLGNVLPS